MTVSIYTAVDLLLDGVAIAVAAVGGTYAIRTLLLLERNQEVLKTQHRIWLPVLYAAGFLALDRVLHLSADLVPSAIPADALDFIQVLLLIASLSLLSLGVYRYWRVQKEYDTEKFRVRAKETA